MLATRFKRILICLFPALFVTLALQYHRAGKIEAYGAGVTLIAFLAMYFASNRLTTLWVHVFGASRAAVNGLAVLWGVLAIGLFAFFYRMM
ncbi:MULTISPECIES: hypothetical protein [unclassified Paraburkholderia]|uniref:hypothetical protein n=1 Tax=unclassified Paraburkholderia TaxID=2615204 RepID=UPI002AB0C8CD|nr:MULTISPECIES: hypothetical protein [unclassified Paraburkholderia]